METYIGHEVLIFGGVSHFAHGRVERVDVTFERPFAFVRLRRKDGKLSKGKMMTLVPLSRCASFGEAPQKGPRGGTA